MIDETILFERRRKASERFLHDYDQFGRNDPRTKQSCYDSYYYEILINALDLDDEYDEWLKGQN